MKDENEHQYHLRLPEELYEQLEDLAMKQNRSVNKMIVFLLRQGVERQKYLDKLFHGIDK